MNKFAVAECGVGLAHMEFGIGAVHCACCYVSYSSTLLLEAVGEPPRVILELNSVEKEN